MTRLLNRLSAFVKTSIKWISRLKNIPQPKTEKDLQNPLFSAVSAAFEREYPIDHTAIEAVKTTKSLLILLSTLTAVTYAPKSA